MDTSLVKFHPYSQNAAKPVVVRASTSRAQTSKSSSIQTPIIRLADMTNINRTYEEQMYTNSLKTKPSLGNNFLTQNSSVKRGANKGKITDENTLKRKLNENANSSVARKSQRIASSSAGVDQRQASLTTSNESQCMKIFTGTTKSIMFYMNKPQFKRTNSGDNSKQVGVFMFEIMGQLDSAITTGNENGSREFTIKDQYGRMPCVFYEIDRKLDRLPRDSYIRCIGKYDFKKSIFHCMSVRLVSEAELFSFGFFVNQTNSHIKIKYL